MSDKNETYLNLNEAAYNVMSGKTPEPEAVNEEMRMRMPRPPGSPPRGPHPSDIPTRLPGGTPVSPSPKGPVPFRKGVEGEVYNDPYLDPFGGLRGIEDGPFPILTPDDEPLLPPDERPEHPYRKPYPGIPEIPGSDPNYYDPYGDHDGDGIPNVFDSDNRYFHPYSDPSDSDPMTIDPFPALKRPGYIPGRPHPGGYHDTPQDPGVNPFHRNPYYVPPGGTPTDPNYPLGYEDVEGEVAHRRGVEGEEPEPGTPGHQPPVLPIQVPKGPGGRPVAPYSPNYRPKSPKPMGPPTPDNPYVVPYYPIPGYTPSGVDNPLSPYYDPMSPYEGEVVPKGGPKAGRMRLDRRGRGY